MKRECQHSHNILKFDKLYMIWIGPVTFYYKDVKILSVGNIEIEYKEQITEHNEDEFNRQVGERMKYFFIIKLIEDYFDQFNSILYDAVINMTNDQDEWLKLIDWFFDWFENDYENNVRNIPNGNKNEALFAFNGERSSNEVMEIITNNISFTFK